MWMVQLKWTSDGECLRSHSVAFPQMLVIERTSKDIYSAPITVWPFACSHSPWVDARQFLTNSFGKHTKFADECLFGFRSVYEYTVIHTNQWTFGSWLSSLVYPHLKTGSWLSWLVYPRLKALFQDKSHNFAWFSYDTKVSTGHQKSAFGFQSHKTRVLWGNDYYGKYYTFLKKISWSPFAISKSFFFVTFFECPPPPNWLTLWTRHWAEASRFALIFFLNICT